MKHLLIPVLTLVSAVAVAQTPINIQESDVMRSDSVKTIMSSEPVLKLSLEQALDIALSENPTIKIADKDIEIKRYAKKGTYSSLYPRLDGTATYQRLIEQQSMAMSMDGETRRIRVGSDNSFTGGLSASMPIVDAQLWTRMKMSVLDIDMAVEKARSSRINMIESVTEAYYTILLAKQTVSVYQSVYDNAVENNKNIRKKFDVGSVSEYELIRSNVTVQNAIPAVFSAENAVTLALWQLKALLGLDLKREIDVTGNLMDFEGVMNQAYELSQINLDTNTEMIQLGIQEQLLEKSIRLSKMANVPTLSISASYLYNAVGNDGNFFVKDAWNPYSYAGLQLNIPIFAGGQKRAATAQAKLNLENLQLQRENVERQLRVQMAQCMNNMQSNIKQYHSAAATVAQAKRGYDIAVKRYEVGSGTLLEIDDTQLALTRSELQRNTSIYDFLTSKVQLDRIIGKYEQEIK